MSKTEVGAFLTRHRGALATAPAATLELVAALILAERDPAWATPRLTSCAGLSERADRASCADRLATAHRVARRGPEMVAALEALGGLLDDSQVVPEAMATALVLANRVPDAIAALDRALAVRPRPGPRDHPRRAGGAHRSSRRPDRGRGRDREAPARPAGATTTRPGCRPTSAIPRRSRRSNRSSRRTPHGTRATPTPSPR
jgi:hypothetical protein